MDHLLFASLFSHLLKNLNTSNPSEHPPNNQGGKCQNASVVGVNIDCKDKNSSYLLIGFHDGGSIGSTA